MKHLLTAAFIWMATLATPANASDFDWTLAFNKQYSLAADQFFDKMALRFAISNEGLSAVVAATNNYADAYLVFKTAEMSGKPVDEVLTQYKAHKGNGWGALAKRLGIKPGSEAFKALKKGHDLDAPAKGDASVTVNIQINGSTSLGSDKKK